MLNHFTFAKILGINAFAFVILLNQFTASRPPVKINCVFTARSLSADNILFPAADPCCTDHSCNGPSNCDATPFSVFLAPAGAHLGLHNFPSERLIVHNIPSKDVICEFIGRIESNIQNMDLIIILLTINSCKDESRSSGTG